VGVRFGGVPKPRCSPHPHLGATASAEGRLLKGGPFPATVSAEGAQFNVPPSPARREGAKLGESEDPQDMYEVLYAD
jgi:hypothetical protein